MIKKFENFLFKPVDNSPLVLFRAIFGLLITLEAWGAIATGWVYSAFIEPRMTFPFIDFSWLQPLPGYGMYFYFLLMGSFGIMVMLGYRYRVAMAGYAVMWSMVYLMQKTHYNNHYYLLMLLCFLMCFLPAHRYFSLDARRNPSIKSLTCPNWCVFIFIAQIGIVYTYAGIAKINEDWLQTASIKMLLAGKQNYWLVGKMLQERWVHWFIAVGGMLFDLLITPLLLWKKTRRYAFGASVFFHLFNSAIFQVGIFPYLGIAFCIFFFPPETIRRIFFKNRMPASLSASYVPHKPLMAGIALWLLVQVTLPSRHWLFDSNVHWTEEGHRLSWRMMLRAKGGYVDFKVVYPHTQDTVLVDKSNYLTPKQQRTIATRPDMCWQFVQHLKKELGGDAPVEIYAIGKVSLNGRTPAPLYNPERNLAEVKWYRFKKSDWLLPLEQE